MVSLVFFFSWAPMNIYNLVIDIGHPFKVTMSMSTAKTNPVLYAFCNENFKQVGEIIILMKVEYHGF